MVQEHVIERYVVRMILRGLGVVLLVAVLAYPLDWVVWRVRVAHGSGMDSVQVQMYTVAELKGGKEDYYPNGSATVACSKSLYPQGGNGVCWWVRRHPELIQRY